MVVMGVMGEMGGLGIDRYARNTIGEAGRQILNLNLNFQSSIPYYLEEIGVDVGEKDGAEAFDLDYDMTVFADALHVALLSLEDAAGDADVLSGFEVFAVVDFAA